MTSSPLSGAVGVASTAGRRSFHKDDLPNDRPASGRHGRGERDRGQHDDKPAMPGRDETETLEPPTAAFRSQNRVPLLALRCCQELSLQMGYRIAHQASPFRSWVCSAARPRLTRLRMTLSEQRSSAAISA